MKKIILITLTLLFSLAVIACKENEEKAFKESSKTTSKKPNIVLLFVDDWGWMDIGYRNDIFETPNINQLKKKH